MSKITVYLRAETDEGGFFQIPAGRELRAARSLLGMTFDEVVAKLGTSQQGHISRAALIRWEQLDGEAAQPTEKLLAYIGFLTDQGIQFYDGGVRLIR